MATTGIGFRWLDILEKEFDKACVELDTSLTDIEAEDPDVVFSARQKIATLSSCFSQLTHKALTIFQNSAKMEAELVDMRAELVQARAGGGAGGLGSGDCAGNVPEGPLRSRSHSHRQRVEAAQLARENAALRETVLALHSELFGARLATKYLDKELAGRIQQLQLLGRDMRAEVRDSLWAQVEAEILLQRHKMLVRVCRGLAPCPPRPPRPPRPEHVAPAPAVAAAPPASRPRTVRVRRSPHLGLGISITGGREHDVPILISELEAGGPAALTGQLYVGDAILAINELDLTQAWHKEAVQALQSVKGDCALCVQFIATDDDDQLSDDNYRFPLYPDDGEVYAAEPDGSGATPTAPRTPDYNRRQSEVGSASGSGSERGGGHGGGYAHSGYAAINNNLSILDMDEDSIKICARPLPSSPLSPLSPRSPLSPDSPHSNHSPCSPHSTPVHARRVNGKKKRAKPAPRPPPQSSDEAPASPLAPPFPRYTVANGYGISTVFDKPAPPSSPSPPPAPMPAPAPAPATAPDRQRVNGLDNKLLKNRTFRIGSAKRISEAAPVLANGDTGEGRALLARLLPGDGDPDFGTPV